MAKSKYLHCVRIAIPRERTNIFSASPIDDGFLDCLRYAGLISVQIDDDERQCFDINCPNAIGRPRIWAEMNAERMRSFGYNAQAISKRIG